MSVLTPTGPRWAVVRQHHRPVRVAAALLGAVLALAAGLRVWVAFARDEAACAAGDTLGCEERIFNGQGTPSGLLRLTLELLSVGLPFLPLLVGAFVAGPMIARELESGTYKLAWTQSVTPARWLATKLAFAGGVVAAATVLVTVVYRATLGPVATYALTWHDRGGFMAQGPTLAAYCLLGVAVGALVGQLVRRSIAAMAVTGLVTGVVVLVLGALRWDLWPTVTSTSGDPSRATGFPAPEDALPLDSGFLTVNGDRVPYGSCWRSGGFDGCANRADITGKYVEYHPAAHFWNIQLVECGIVLALTALAAFLAFRALRRLHA
ncbi:ABC transporter permease [Streptomyces coeruleoprunus]|uniref:ABC transporter permease n=1 Tax=Streptomyces coeruleoprunus TaxID=285563 RepID=A0ABV9XIJ6_9ACTN